MISEKLAARYQPFKSDLPDSTAAGKVLDLDGTTHLSALWSTVYRIVRQLSKTGYVETIDAFKCFKCQR